MRRLSLLCLFPVVAACGSRGPSTSAGAAPPVATASATSDASAPAPAAHAFDPVAQGNTAEGIRAVCDEHLGLAQKHLDGLRAMKGAPPEKLSYDATLGLFDDVVFEVQNASAFPSLMAVAHPDKAVRDAAQECQPKADKFMTALYLDADVAAVLKAFAAGEGSKLEGERKKLLHDVLRDYRRNGLDLPPDKQERLRALNAEITEIGQKFEVNIASSTGKIEVDAKKLEGLPPEYVAKHPPDAKGKVTITTDYPDYFPFSTYAKDRKAALDLYVLFVNRGGEENMKLLDRLLGLRAEKAKLLGYPSWAAYAIEPRMAKDPKTVRAFLDRVRDAVKEPAKNEMKELMKEHVALGGRATDRLPPSERLYLEDIVRSKKYKLNSQELSQYFEVGAVIQGLLDVSSKMYGIEFRKVPDKTWHADVTAYDVWDARGQKPLGKIYLDLYSRPDKYKHAAMFGVRPAKGAQLPMSALACNFPKPGGGEPALMNHDEVVTFFHEFGHVLHSILTESQLASFAGAATANDFVEAPSQMFEEWAWSREILDMFARHHKTGAKIPDELFAAMTRARAFGRAIATQRQLVFAYLDLEYHSREPGFDTTKIYAELQDTVDSFKYVPGTHFQTSFGHIVNYDAGYYGYQWALSISRDVLTRFQKEGLINPKTAAAWREEVLSKGGGVDERTMITRFLGREPSDAAYAEFLKGR